MTVDSVSTIVELHRQVAVLTVSTVVVENALHPIFGCSLLWQTLTVSLQNSGDVGLFNQLVNVIDVV